MSLITNETLLIRAYKSIRRRLSSGLDYGTGRLPPQYKLQGRYQILEKVGKGGMGAVYLALDTAGGYRQVAVKEMSQTGLDMSDLADATRQFYEEATLLRSLTQANLPRVYAWFQEQNRSYLVMDFIKGETLLQLLKRSGGHPLDVQQVVEYAIQLCNVLTYLHEHQPPIIFRDLKPSNVMVTETGQIYLIDFGIARFFKEGQISDTRLLGTKGYAAPELYENKQTGPCSDLYSLGATLHHCLTGLNPLSNRLFVFAPASQENRLVPAKLDMLVQRLLQTEIGNRPASAREVKQELLSLDAISLSSVANGPQTPLPATPNLGWQSPVRLPGDSLIPVPYDAITDDKFPSPQTPIPAVWGGPPNPAVAVPPFVPQPRWGGPAQPAIPARPQRATPLSKIVHQTLTTWAADVWTWRFKAVLALFLVAAAGGSIYTLSAYHGSYHVAGLYLSLLLLVVALFANTSKHISDAVPRSILFFVALAMIIVAITLQALPDVQAALQLGPHISTVSDLCVIVLILGAIVVLVRRRDLSAVQQPANTSASKKANKTHEPLAWIEHLVVTFTLLICICLYYTYVPQALQQMIPQLSSDTATSINDVFIVGLIVLASISLLRTFQPFKRGDHVIVLLAAIFFAYLQFTFGYNELAHLIQPTQSLQVVQVSTGSQQILNVINVLLTFVPTIITAIAIIDLRTGLAWIKRMATPALAVACMLLLSFLGNGTHVPFVAQYLFSFGIKVFASIHLYQLLGAVFIIASLFFLFRLGRPFHWLDRVMVFGIVIASALFQSAAWDSGQSQNVSTQTVAANQTTTSQQFVISASQIVVYLMDGIMIVVLIGLLVATALRLLPATSGTSRSQWIANGIDKVVLWADRALVIGSILLSITLQATLNSISQTISLLTVPNPTYNSSAVLGAFILCLSIVLIIFGGVLFYRLFSRKDRPFHLVERLAAILGCAISLFLLFFWNQIEIQSLPLLSARVQITGNILHASPELLAILLLIGFLLIAAASVYWLTRSYDQVERYRLLSVLALACFCLLFQFIAPFLLLPALILLLVGTLVAIQIERVRV